MLLRSFARNPRPAVKASEESILRRISDLSPMPAVVLRVITLAEDQKVGLQQLADVIRYDQGLTVRLLRLCNSSFMGLPHPVESLKEAVQFLGTTTVRSVAVLAHTAQMLTTQLEAHRQLQEVLWEHSVAVALTAQRLAEKVGGIAPGSAFTAGLLHDLGMLALHEFDEERFKEVVETSDQARATLLEAERNVLGTSHEEIGAKIAETWNLPAYVVQAIRHHHTPSRAGEYRRLTSVIHVADSVAARAGHSLRDRSQPPQELEPGTLQYLGLAEGDVQAATLALPADLKIAKDMLGSSGLHT